MGTNAGVREGCAKSEARNNARVAPIYMVGAPSRRYEYPIEYTYNYSYFFPFKFIIIVIYFRLILYPISSLPQFARSRESRS